MKVEKKWYLSSIHNGYSKNEKGILYSKALIKKHTPGKTVLTENYRLK